MDQLPDLPKVISYSLCGAISKNKALDCFYFDYFKKNLDMLCLYPHH